MTDCYIRSKGWEEVDFGSFSPEEAIYYAQELKASGIDSVLGLRVAELGYGNGAFAGWVRKTGGTWVGREVIPELQQRAMRAGFQTISSGEDFSNVCGAGKLDLIVAFDVVEHMELDAIRVFLTEVKSTIKTGGLLLIRLPSGDSPFAGANYYGDVTHRTLLGSSAICQLAIEAGLEVCQIRSPVLPIWGLGPVRAIRRMGVRLVQTFAYPFIRYALMGQRNAVISPNIVAILRKRDSRF